VKIRSYPISIEDRFEIELPQHAKVLTVHEQRGQPKIWVMADQEQPKERRRFYLIGSDKEINFDPESCTYVGSFQAGGDVLVFHVFVES
jgi:hypothetical protein